MDIILGAVAVIGLVGFFGYQWLCYRTASKGEYGVRTSTYERD